MGASAYMVGNAPQGASYAAPLVGQQIGQQIGSLPADYMQGRQFARQRAIQDAFPNGIPTRPDGSPDTDQIMSTMGRLGGGEYIQGLMPYLLQTEGARNIGQGLGNVDNFVNARSAPAASGPANLATRPQSSPPVASPQGAAPQGPMSSTGMDDNGQDTIRTLATAAGRGKDMTNTIGTIERTYGWKADAALQPDQVRRVNNFLANAVGVGANDQNSNQQPTSPAQDKVDSDYPFGDKEANMETMGRIDKAIAYLNGLAVRASASGNKLAEDAIRKQIDIYQARRGQITDYMSKGEQLQHETEETNKRLTGEEKNARNPSVLAAQEQGERNKLNVKRWNDDQQAYVKMARQADAERPQIAIAQKMTQSPGFIAGAGQTFRDTMANIAQSVGLNTDASTNQIFDKIRAGGILSQIKGMAGTGPIRVAEMNFIKTMMAGRENQPEALRAVLNIQDRLYQRSQEIRDIIRQNGGNIDKRVEDLIEQHVNDRPLLSGDEMKDYHIIGAPRFDTVEAMRAAGLPHGARFITSDGRAGYAP
jgi:hypothetical protein